MATLHELAAVHFMQPMYVAYRSIRAAHRASLKACQSGMAFRRAAANWTTDGKRDWVLERLRDTVRYAYANSAYYKRTLDEIGFDPRAAFGFAEYARVPVLERHDIRLNSLVLDSIAHREIRRDSTGGTSGEPTVVWRGPLERGWNESGVEYFMRQLNLPPGSSTGLLWGHHLDPVASDAFFDRARFFAENLRWFDCLRIAPEALDKYHAQLLEWRPRCVIAYASALGAFAEHLDSRGIRTSAYPRVAFVTGAEKLLAHHRAIIERVFERPVHERYGSRDVALIGFQLQPWHSLQFAIDWSNVFVEPESSDAYSSILVTKLHADAMPMLRYRIGDIGAFPMGSSPGHPVFALDEVLGREVDRIWLPDGHWVNGLSFPHLMKDFGVRLFQLIQAEDLSVCVRIAPDSNFNNVAMIEIERLIRANLADLPVTLELVDDIPRGIANKWRPVVSKATPPSVVQYQ